MPIWKSRRNRALIWRPNGMPYSEGTQPASVSVMQEENVARAIENAFDAFRSEFDREPDIDQVVIEVVLSRGDAWTASLFEVPIEP